MLEQTLLPERIFGLAVVDGRRTVRPGAVVRFRFRARNPSEVATPAARLSFALPFGWSALDALDAEIPPVRPGGEHIVWFGARPDLADEATALSRFQSVLQLGDMVLGSNVVNVRVTGNARFSAPASGIRVEPAGGARLRVAVDVVNEGDAAARNVRIAVPPPPGFRVAGGTTVASTAELQPGAALAFAYEMEPVAPASPMVRVDDAFVTFDGGRVALMTGAGHRLAPNLLAPEIVSTRAATRLETTIRIANDGWVPAHDVRVAIELTAGWRILRGTMLADGAPAVIRRDPGAENGVTIVLPFVPARGGVEVSVISSSSRPCTDGAIVVRCGSHAVEARLPDPVRRALQLDARPESPFAVPGASMAVAVDASNHGETRENVSIWLNGEVAWRGEIKPGSASAFAARFVAPEDARDGDRVTLRVEARGSDDEALASAAIELRVVDRPWIAVDEVTVDGDDACVIVRNVGATTVRDVRIDDESDVRIAALAPGETHAIVLGIARMRNAAVVSAGGTSIPIGWDVRPDAVPVEAELVLVHAIRAGERLDIRLRCVAASALETLRVRPHPQSGAVYVAGSTTVNGYAIVDGVDGPPLLLGDGLALHDIPAGTIAEVAWSLLPRTPGDLVVGVGLEANGAIVELADARVRVSDAVPFGARPSALPFHVDAATVGDPAATSVVCDIPAALPAEWPSDIDADHAERRLADHVRALSYAPGGAGTFVLQYALDDVRLAAIRRVLRGSRGPGIVGHLPAIAVLLPTEIGADPTVRAALGTATESVRGVYERLFVKLRIPGYDVTPFDLEDNATRHGLLHFLRAAAAGDTLPPYGCADLRVAISSSTLESGLETLVNAPLGGSVTLATIASLLPRGSAGDVGVVGIVGAYAAHLATELGETRALSHDAFTSYVTMHRSSSLDAARDAAIAALDASGVLAGG